MNVTQLRAQIFDDLVSQLGLVAGKINNNKWKFLNCTAAQVYADRWSAWTFCQEGMFNSIAQNNVKWRSEIIYFTSSEEVGWVIFVFIVKLSESVAKYKNNRSWADLLGWSVVSNNHTSLLLLCLFQGLNSNKFQTLLSLQHGQHLGPTVRNQQWVKPFKVIGLTVSFVKMMMKHN